MENSIDVLGKFLIKYDDCKIISKFINDSQADLHIELLKTLERLNVPNLYCYMFHRFSDLTAFPELMDQLNNMKLKGAIKHIGVSIYSDIEFEEAIKNHDVDIVQTPYNLLDNENYRGDLIARAKQNNKIVHARSVFLQGLFFKKEMPENLTPLEKYIQKLREISEQHSIRMNAFALSYAFANKNIDGVIVGIDSLSQLKENLSTIKSDFNQEVLNKVKTIEVERRDLLNPTNW